MCTCVRNYWSMVDKWPNQDFPLEVPSWTPQPLHWFSSRGPRMVTTNPRLVTMSEGTEPGFPNSGLCSRLGLWMYLASTFPWPPHAGDSGNSHFAILLPWEAGLWAKALCSTGYMSNWAITKNYLNLSEPDSYFQSIGNSGHLLHQLIPS